MGPLRISATTGREVRPVSVGDGGLQRDGKADLATANSEQHSKRSWAMATAPSRHAETTEQDRLPIRWQLRTLTGWEPRTGDGRRNFPARISVLWGMATAPSKCMLDYGTRQRSSLRPRAETLQRYGKLISSTRIRFGAAARLSLILLGDGDGTFQAVTVEVRHAPPRRIRRLPIFNR